MIARKRVIRSGLSDLGGIVASYSEGLALRTRGGVSPITSAPVAITVGIIFGSWYRAAAALLPLPGRTV